MNDPIHTPSRAGGRRMLVIALVASVALNLLLVGIGIGHRLAGPPPMLQTTPMFGLMQFARTLPEDRQQALMEEFGAYRNTARPAFREMRGLQQRLRDQIRSEVLDPVALKAALDALQSHMQDNQATNHEAFVRLMQLLTYEERLALDASFATARGRHSGGQGHGPRQGF
jgi:hypothetical protein